MDTHDYLPHYLELFSVSDLHLGGYDGEYRQTPRNFRVFNQSAGLAWLIGHVTETAQQTNRTALVLNGDTVDFLAQPNAKAFDADGALHHLKSIIRDPAFSPVWKALRAFVTSKTGDLVIVLGNHDVELGLPALQGYLTHYLTGDDPEARTHLILAMDGRGFRCRVGQAQVLCVHGNEFDEFNAVDYGSLHLVARALNFGTDPPAFTVNAGSTLVTAAMNLIKRRFQWVDLLKPEREAVLRILGALPRAFFNEVPFKQALGDALRVRHLVKRDRQRLAEGLLGNGDAVGMAGDGEATEGAVQKHLHALIGDEGFDSGSDTEALLEVAERNRARGIRATDLVDQDGPADQPEELLSFVGDAWAALTTNPVTKREHLRAVLTETLTFATHFSPTAAPDEDLDQLDAHVGTNIDFLVAGHTHFEKSLERKLAGTYYLNSGTWIRLIDLQDKLEADTFKKVWNILLDGSMECLDGDCGAPDLARVRPGDSAPPPKQAPFRLSKVVRSVVHLSATEEREPGSDVATLGELAHVEGPQSPTAEPADVAASGDFKLALVAGTQRIWHP